jgi:hypothetical protein
MLNLRMLASAVVIAEQALFEPPITLGQGLLKRDEFGVNMVGVTHQLGCEF